MKLIGFGLTSQDDPNKVNCSSLPTAVANEFVMLFNDRCNLNLQKYLCPSTTIAGWMFSNDDLNEAIAGERLLCPSLDLSPVCNLDCAYCFQAKKLPRGAASRTLSLETTRSIVVEMARAGARTINIIGAGEPLLDPHFEEVARLIHDCGVRLLVATNGVPLTKRPSLVETLVEIQASVVVKMNSMRLEIEDAMVGRPGYALQRNHALKMLLEAGFARNRPTRLAVNTVITIGNEAEILDMHRFCREQNICFIAGTYMPAGRTDTNSGILQAGPYLEPLPFARLAKITRTIREIDGTAATRGDFPAYTSDLPCVQALGLYVDSEGSVWPCPTKKIIRDGVLIDESLADIRGGLDLLKIWAGNGYIRKIRRSYSGECPYKALACKGIRR